MRMLTLAAAVACSAGLAACTTSPTGKSIASAQVAGAHLVQAGQVMSLVVALDAATGHPHASIDADLTAASSALTVAGQSLEASAAVSGDLTANVKLASAALTATVAAIGDYSPTTGATVQGYLDAARTVVALYNTEAPLSGLPTIPAF